MTLQLPIIILSLIIGATLITLGLIFQKKGFLLSLAGGIIFIIAGITMLGSPIQFISGSQILINGTTITTDYVYESQNTNITNILSWVIMIIGFATTTMSAVRLWHNKLENVEDHDIR